MKSTTVPAQITSVEDDIAGSLSMTQVVLLVIPIFTSALVFAGLPPTMHLAIYKIILLIIFGLPPLLLAIRVREIIVLRWLLLVVGYSFRPKQYLHTVKYHHNCFCQQSFIKDKNDQVVIDLVELKKVPKIEVSIAERLLVGNVLKQNSVKFYADGRGKLNASIK